MAYYAALVPLVQLLKDISHHDRHPNSLLDKQQITSLYEKFNLLQELLEDYFPNDLKEESADILESRIRDSAHETQDIIESHISDVIPQQLEGLEKVKEEADSIVREIVRIKESHTTREHVQLNSLISSDSARGESKVQAPCGRNIIVGLEEHQTALKGQLCGESSRREVISIVGMGGLGKTTLARNIFDDEYVVYHFYCRAWVTISQDYHMRKVLLDIGNSMNILNEELSKQGEQVLKEHIRRHLMGMKYLIVIDDIWDIKVWDDLKMIFPDQSNGSRILITTRVSDVAVYGGGSKFLHQMQFLDEDKSWTLLREKVFGQEHCPEELEAIGKLIASNCRGLPLAIVVIAGVLSNVNKSQHDWEEIAKNVSSVAIVQNDEDFSKILSLSYNNLPHHLKPCFLYLGGFPEDHEIPISKLIRLWVAEGFLKPSEYKSLEEVGEEYLEDLVNRNLVLITKKTSKGELKRCIIHDLLRDLCSQRAHYEKFLHCLHGRDDFRQEAVRDVRRFYIQMWTDSLLCKYREEHLLHVRAIIFFDNESAWGQFFSIASAFKLLKVLDAWNIKFTSFPNVIVELLHLRYLAAQATGICIPPSIFKLQNLQTLVVDGFSSLPSEVWKMPHLRHVMIKDIKLAPVPYDERIIGEVPHLGRLQTLWRVTDFKFSIDTIEMIPNLKELKVTYTEMAGIWEEFGLNNLVLLRQLESLEIYFSGIALLAEYLIARKVIPFSLPENFSFPSTLIKLTLGSCGISWKDMRVVGSLPNLQVLKLIDNAFVGKEWEPVEGEFSRLKFMLLYGLDDLEYWRAENTQFPCLEHLQIRECKNLQEIPPGIGDITTLQCIEVYYSNPALEASALKIQEEQRDQGNDYLHVLVVSRN